MSAYQAASWYMTDEQVKELVDRVDPQAWARYLERYAYAAPIRCQSIRRALAEESLAGTIRQLYAWGGDRVDETEVIDAFARALRAEAGLPPDLVLVRGDEIIVRGRVWARAVGDTEVERSGRAEVIRGTLAAALSATPSATS